MIKYPEVPNGFQGEYFFDQNLFIKKNQGIRSMQGILTR